MKTIGVIANPNKERAADVLRTVASVSARVGIVLMADEATAALLGISEFVTSDEMFDRVDAVMALGGDGTMLRVARALGGRKKPVIGVNIGALGFLTSIAEEDLECAIQCLADDNFITTKAFVLEGEVFRSGKMVAKYRALNEIVVSRGVSTRMATLDVTVDNDVVTSYQCDGVIVSSPVGSTGHSLSAGGPIIVPSTKAFVVTPICPHTLSSRPLVIPDSSEVAVTVIGAATDLVLSVDGQDGQGLRESDRVVIRRSKADVEFIHMPGYSYFSVLSQKLGWRGSSV
ncbi:MAG: NAD(+)/NADH kinase [Lentisphaerae bacterium]|nr:NAD(+)/NADH kinase [Lentisphaerota bacterium]